jgi:hypothetical protein
MALIKKIILLIKFIFIYWLKLKRNLLLFFIFNSFLIALIFFKIHYFLFLNFLLFSFYPLIQLYNDDKILVENRFYEVYDLKLMEVHTAKIILLYLLVFIQLIIIYFYLKLQRPQININFFQLISGIILTFILAVNFYKIKQNWLKLLLFLISNSLISFIISLAGWEIFLPVGVIILLSFTVYTLRNEYNSYF